MKVVIVGGGEVVGIALARRFVEAGIEAEVREATPAEERYCARSHTVELEVREAPIIAFEQPRFNGYMGKRHKRRY
jgi:predicted dinucleotide-binding enzyme